MSGRRTHSLLVDAAAAGVASCSALSAGTGRARDLSKRLLKLGQWPDLYMADVRVFDPKRSAVVTEQVAFLLPHEVLSVISKIGDDDLLHCTDMMDPMSLAHLRRCEEQVGGKMVGLGLWGDAAPCNWDRSESIHVFSMNMPGLTGDWKTLRIPITCLSKKNIAQKDTYDDILAVLAWSLQHCATGAFPKCRHDGTPWSSSDHNRAKNSSKTLGLKACLCEVRGDWAFLKECFGFPAWNEVRGMCWRCKCTPSELRDCGLGAAWRANRLSHVCNAFYVCESAMATM